MTGWMLDDDGLTNRWASCALGRPITHEEHLRIARLLVHRHGRHHATRRLVDATRANCEAMNAVERFDERLTRRWSERIADAVASGDGATFEDFIAVHPELTRSDLLGPPAWKTPERGRGAA
jgi:hypothetical protein